MMSWYQEAMVGGGRRRALRERSACSRSRTFFNVLEEAVAWLFLAGWAFAIAAEVMR